MLFRVQWQRCGQCGALARVVGRRSSPAVRHRRIVQQFDAHLVVRATGFECEPGGLE